MHAARNISLCTKDCVCLFVCPTGATDTENGQIDFAKCIDGCRLCVDACPSRALYLVPASYAPPQKKSTPVKNALLSLAASKTEQETLAAAIAGETGSPVVRQLARAVEKSNRLMAEDCLREAGFMLPQSREVTVLLESLLDRAVTAGDSEFPRDVAEKLLLLLKQ
jgi:Fe-S-cluster-containing hydrogenase component 2